VSWFRVDDKSAFHRKVLKAGNEAWGAICRAGAVSSGEGTDGVVTLETMLAIAPMRVWKKGLDAGLVEAIDGATYQLHDYLQWNESASEIEAKAAARRKKSENAAQARWGARGRIRSDEQTPSAPEGVPEPCSSDAPSMPGALPQAHTPRCPDPIRSDPDPGSISERSSLPSPPEAPAPGAAAAGSGLVDHLGRALAARPETRPIATRSWAASLLGAAGPITAADIDEAVEWAARQLAIDAADAGGGVLHNRAIGERVSSGLVGALRRRQNGRTRPRRTVQPVPRQEDLAPPTKTDDPSFEKPMEPA
jgi:hypothetical protein